MPRAVTETERQRRLMASKRAAERDIIIPPVENPRRRRRCRNKPHVWLRTYMPHVFTHPFTDDQSEMVDEVMARIRYGGEKAVAAPRGDGKTSIIKGCVAYAIAEGFLNFPLVIAKNQAAANLIQRDIKHQFERNELIAADYPEICAPIRALRGAPSKAGGMTVGGASVQMSWSGDFLVFPTVPGSKASGTVLAARGIESAFRGFNYDGQRPDLVILDDPEDRQSARSALDIRRAVETIDRDIAGLGGQDESIAVIYLCTIITAECVAATYTDRTKRPAWGGVRKKFLTAMPTNMEMWHEYFRLRIADQLANDRNSRNAHKHYIKHRKKMDEGAQVANPHRYDKRQRPEGGTVEISALQHAFNFICDKDWTSFNAEYQNIPPQDEAAETDNLDAPAVMRRLSGRDQGVVPPDCDYLTATIDVHGRRLDWEIVAWVRGYGEIIDYGEDAVHSPLTGKLCDEANTEKVDDAILSALCNWRDNVAGGWPIEPLTSDPPEYADRRRGLDLVLIDVGWRPDPVFAFIYAQIKAGDRTFKACEGRGSRGRARYTHPSTKGPGKKLFKTSEYVHGRRQPKRKAWLYAFDDNHFKAYAQDAFSVPIGRPGSLVLFGEDPIRHRNFACQIVSEKRRRMFVAGRGYVEDWDVVDRENHKLDCTKMNVVAVIIAGMSLIKDVEPEKPTPPPAESEEPTTIIKNKPRRKRRKLSEMPRRRR